MAAAMNLLEYAETLEHGGFSAEQARTAAHALGQAIDPQLVSLSALVAQGVRHDRRFDDLESTTNRRFDDAKRAMAEQFAEFERRMDVRFVEFEHRTDARFDQMDRKIDAHRAEAKVDMGKLEAKLLFWMVTILVVQSGTTALLFKLLH